MKEIGEAIAIIIVMAAAMFVISPIGTVHFFTGVIKTFNADLAAEPACQKGIR